MAPLAFSTAGGVPGKAFFAAARGGGWWHLLPGDRDERRSALAEFGNAVAATATVGTNKVAEPIVYADWDDALRRRSGLVVIDEFPYLLRHSPELPSLLQRIVDEAANSARLPVRFLLCGSSLSVMSTLLRGQEPLRGRATLDMFLRPMDHRQAATLWGVDDYELAVRLHAIFGGAPSYRALTTGLAVATEHLGEWLGNNVLNASHALFREDDYLLQEERTITDRALYGSILQAIASGVVSQTELAGRLGRSRESLTHPLTTLVRAGFVVRHEDLPTLRRVRTSRRRDRVQRRSHAGVRPAHSEIGRRRRRRDRRARRDRRGESGDSTSRRSEMVRKNAFGPDAVDGLAYDRCLLGALGHNVESCELALISRVRSSTPGEGLRIGLDQLYK